MTRLGILDGTPFDERARRELGDRFDLRDFHDMVIGSGSMPLDVLTRQVDRYITQRS